MQTWKLIASGIVQGVGFRWSVQNCAQNLGINGTVRNNSDSTVTIILQADRDTLDKFVKKLPDFISPFAKIADINITKLSGVEKMHGFHVLY
ncbi:acylphosphatase [Lactobacillus kalixensis]|uniref:acylphosphatase n=1 Tax=Lactobacillus kalixensis DSM 16043 TaxID=1423763 RepID=A0A0R1UCL7_9LACO|nr:acylphosphatase [Lactobacillus kalixensis]KRL90990.1 hypothetical protein FC46_GL001283 [Lactobacillus kalixensis DSM 16043]